MGMDVSPSNRKDMAEDILDKIEEITMDSGKSAAIVSASKMSMGMDVSPIDLINIMSFSSRVISLTEYRKSLVDYLHKRMASVAPNLSTLIGDVVGARLISHAGSLTNLAKCPASTVQILGAEKALFRALKTKGNTPKFGLIFHSSFIGRAGSKNKGRISRFLANKCSIASRIDCFSEISTKLYGEKLKEQVEDRLKYYESGDLPKKNVDAMQEAIAAVKEEATTFEEVKKKKKDKKSKKRNAEEMEDEKENEIQPKNGAVANGNGIHEEEVEAPKKKKAKPDVDATITTNGTETPTTEKKKKKKDKKTFRRTRRSSRSMRNSYYGKEEEKEKDKERGRLNMS